MENKFWMNWWLQSEVWKSFLFRQCQISITKKLFDEAKIEVPRQRAQVQKSVEDGINELNPFFFVYLLNLYLTMLLKLIMTELLYRCNCSKAKATFALRRDLVRQWRSSSRSDEDIGTIKPAYWSPSRGGRWIFVAKRQRIIKTVRHYIWKPLSVSSRLDNPFRQSILGKRSRVSRSHSYIVRPGCGLFKCTGRR